MSECWESLDMDSVSAPYQTISRFVLQGWQWENGEKEEVKLNMELLPLIINGLSLYGCNLELPQVTGSLGRLDYMLVSKDLTTVDLWPSNLSGDGRGIEEWFNLVAAHEKNFCDEFARTTVTVGLLARLRTSISILWGVLEGFITSVGFYGRLLREGLRLTSSQQRVAPTVLQLKCLLETANNTRMWFFFDTMTIYLYQIYGQKPQVY